MKIYIIAGEASGDLHASNLMREMRALKSDIQFRCWGGDLMQQQGGVVVKHYRDLAFMGFTEVLLNLRTILNNLKFCKKDIIDFAPDAVILVDYPGFNLKIAEFLKAKNIPVIYYISPQVWAWKQSRVKTIRRVVDKMMVILPFEKDFYAGHQVDVEFHGHPLLDALENSRFSPVFAESNAPLVALLPGSRKQEIKRVLPEMAKVAVIFPGVRFVVAGVSSLGKEFYAQVPGAGNFEVVFNRTYDLLKQSSAALVTSGTATLETALIGTPEIVCYKGGNISYQIARRIIKVKYISLVNLIMDRKVVTELIQHELNTTNITKELNLLLYDDKTRERIARDYAGLRQKLGGGGASARAAASVLAFLNERQNL